LSLVAALVQKARSVPAHIAAGILLGGLAAMPVGLSSAVVLGTLGGSWGERAFGPIGVPLGLVLTMVLVPLTFFLLGGAIGAVIAWTLGRIIHSVRRHRAGAA
jgi:hypothetical protein